MAYYIQYARYCESLGIGSQTTGVAPQTITRLDSLVLHCSLGVVQTCMHYTGGWGSEFEPVRGRLMVIRDSKRKPRRSLTFPRECTRGAPVA
jgi:hypothetical protein